MPSPDPLDTVLATVQQLDPEALRLADARLALSRCGVQMPREHMKAGRTRTTRAIEVAEAAIREVERLRHERRARWETDSALRERLGDVLQAAGHPLCSTCEGTGGVPIEREVWAASGMSPSHTECVGWTEPHLSPDDEACPDCGGVGITLEGTR